MRFSETEAIMTINPTLLELVAQERRQEDLAGLERRQLLRLLAAQRRSRTTGGQGLAWRTGDWLIQEGQRLKAKYQTDLSGGYRQRGRIA
jgi:hypothetical protein